MKHVIHVSEPDPDLLEDAIDFALLSVDKSTTSEVELRVRCGPVGAQRIIFGEDVRLARFDILKWTARSVAEAIAAAHADLERR